ncbi:cell division protein [Massilia sp. PAMC28688]|uniref:cell division protein n=1 Tax=Massilia sp. PAMC28688 TaxID=2861283 RepID=UPI001C624E75|nr:cell division protein [Massilia sp. PAMC28688]QYF92139.1 cell division protein [Massilia sp. PAMC28688]
MKRDNVRTWAVYLTYASIAGHLLVGALLPLIVGLGMFDSYHRGIEAAFYGAAIPHGARAHQSWWISLFGPTVQAAAVWMAALAYLGARQRSAFAWAALIAGIVLWAPQDMYISLLAGAWAHVWIDSAALVIMLPPLVALYIIDRQVATPSASHPDASGCHGFK